MLAYISLGRPASVGRPGTGRWDINRDPQAAGKLLAELREAYRNPPRHVQADVRHVLGALAREQAAQIIGRKEGEWDDEN
jgi:hypothetical protein